MKEILILSSKYNSNIEAILKHFKNRSDLKFKILFNIPDTKAVAKFKKMNVEAFYLNNDEIEAYFENRKFDLVIMTKFYKILDKRTIDKTLFINIHQSLLPKYQGLNAIKKAYVNQDSKTGITIHYVNEKINDGEIIFQKELFINPSWSLKKIQNEICKLENLYYPKIIEKILALNVLVIGNKTSDNVIAQKISESKYLNKLYLLNPAQNFKHLGEEIVFKGYENLIQTIKEKNINLVIINSHKYFSSGIIELLNKNNIKTIGIDKKFSKLESSKIFAKKLLQKYGIKITPYKKINSKKNTDSYLSYFKTPIIKADGMTPMGGVYFNQDREKIKAELLKYLNGKFDNASTTSLIEEKLSGFEFSLFSLWDGHNLLHLPLCKNIKPDINNICPRGLASICPVQSGLINEQKLDLYKTKLKRLLNCERIKTPFVLCCELMMCDDDLYTIEINTRFCDPEIQSLTNFIKNDWLEIFHAQSNGMLDAIQLKKDKLQSFCVVLASRGYPLKTRLGVEIKLPYDIDKALKIYYSGIIKKNNKLLSEKSRVLSIVSSDKNAIYKYIEKIDFKEKMYIEDINACE